MACQYKSCQLLCSGKVYNVVKTANTLLYAFWLNGLFMCLVPVCLFVQLFERILEIPIFWSKGRASGEVLL
jgi:hypothetical protein